MKRNALLFAGGLAAFAAVGTEKWIRTRVGGRE